MSATAGPNSGRQRDPEGAKVAVLKGGRSLERRVSLRSGAQAEDALQRRRRPAPDVGLRAEVVPGEAPHRRADLQADRADEDHAEKEMQPEQGSHQQGRDDLRAEKDQQNGAGNGGQSRVA